MNSRLLSLLPKEQVFTDELSRLTKGTDAGLYRLIPKAVVKVNSEEEVIRLLKFCVIENTPVTFKAAGTSLSGQTISDSTYRLFSQHDLKEIQTKTRTQTSFDKFSEDWWYYC